MFLPERTEIMESQIQQPKTDRELLEVIHDNSRKTKNYMKWQLIITVALVVIPLLATLILIPIALKQLQSVYSGYGLDSLTGAAGQEGTSKSVQDIIDQYTK
jgi:hypothetical protein